MTVAPRGLALSLGRLTPLPAVWSRPRNMKRGTLLVVLAALTPMNTDDGGTDPSNYVYFSWYYDASAYPFTSYIIHFFTQTHPCAHLPYQTRF